MLMFGWDKEDLRKHLWTLFCEPATELPEKILCAYAYRSESQCKLLCLEKDEGYTVSLKIMRNP